MIFYCVKLTNRLNQPVSQKRGSIVDNKKQSAREKILKTARELFANRGYHATSVKDISTEAGVNKSLLFYYFNSKKNLYDEIFIDLMTKFQREVESYVDLQSGIEERFSALIRFYIDYFASNRQMMKIIIREVLSLGPGMPLSIDEMLSFVRKPLLKVIQEGIIKGIFADFDPEFSLNIIIGSLQIFFRQPAAVSSDYDLDQLHHNLMKFLKNGMFAGSEK